MKNSLKNSKHSYKDMGSQWGLILPPGDIWKCLETYLSILGVAALVAAKDHVLRNSLTVQN